MVRDDIKNTDMDFNQKANIMHGVGFKKKTIRKVIEDDKSKAYSRFDD